MKREIAALMRELETRDARERAQGLPGSARVRNVRPEVGRFLNLLIRATRARRVLEIGTSNGYSTLWLALGVQETGGHVTTLEVDEGRIPEARENFRRAGLSQVITVLPGDARETLTELSGPFDFVFIDAEKSDYVRYLELTVPKLHHGGLLVADNVTSHPEETAEYVARTMSHPELVSVTVPIGRGEQVSLRTRRPISERAQQALAGMEELAGRVPGLRKVPRDAARFLHILAQATGARRVLEIGTSNGYSALWLATGLEATGGRLVTVERDSGKAKMARKNLRAAGLADRVEVKIGEAGRVLRRLPGPFDLVFFDASKEDQLDNLRLVWDRVRSGGLVISNNALTHVAALAAYTAYVRSHPEADSLMVPIGNGFEVTLKTRPA